jgi:phospholipase C
MKWRQIALGSITLAAFASSVAWSAGDGDDHEKNRHDEVHTATPIKHLVVIYGENISFDHYFATYPHATNPSGEPAFRAAPGTPDVNGLSRSLLTSNPNLNPDNGAGKSNPFRLDRTQAATADQNHAYTAEQQAYDNGAADLFPKYTGKGTTGGAGAFGTAGQVMGYFDGNTVTALWNYAQRFAMSDNAYTSTYGPSTPGALEIVSGQTNGMKVVLTTKQPSVAGSYYVDDGQGGYTMINDVDPAYDLCSSATDTALMTGKNIGDLLNDRNISWGGFMGGFNLAKTNSNGTTGCKRSTLSTVVGSATADYIPHHNWFQYYASTSNPKHLRPSSISAIGHSRQKDGRTPDPANHQYDTDDFFNAVKAGNFPAVNFLKAPAYQDGHAGYSDPLDEQAFVTKVVNFLQQQKEWETTAVIVAWDDSDGWYDHAYTLPTSASYDSVADQLNGSGICGTGSALDGVKGKPVNGRCGPGTRTPFIVISPWAKENFVDHTLIDQSSVVRFIEDNWLEGCRIGGGSFDARAGSIMGMFDFNRRGESRYPRKLFLNTETGLPVETPPRL